MITVTLIAISTFDEIPFKIIFGAFALCAAVELASFFKRKHSPGLFFSAFAMLVFLVGGTVFVAITPATLFWYIVLGVPGYDITAYLIGITIGGKIFKKSRPFPRISKNKTWEGTVGGLIVSAVLVAIRLAIRGGLPGEYIYLLCGPLALAGDLFESYLKRQFNVKDSNEILIRNRFFSKLELLVGGSEGHGGFLDRIDSAAFATTILLVLIYVIQ